MAVAAGRLIGVRAGNHEDGTIQASQSSPVDQCTLLKLGGEATLLEARGGGCCRAGPREGNSQVPRRMYLDAGLRCHGDLDQWYQYNPPNKPAPRPSGTA